LLHARSEGFAVALLPANFQAVVAAAAVPRDQVEAAAVRGASARRALT
jgi:hypothetical protein